jgi:hypothetical protein
MALLRRKVEGRNNMLGALFIGNENGFDFENTGNVQRMKCTDKGVNPTGSLLKKQVAQ